jgi:hypothetical protein
MESDIRQLIQAIHDRPGRLVLVTAGAGTQALAWILGVAGASRTLIEALVPYDESSFIDFLGHRPDQHVVASTAGLLAGRALNRARELCPTDDSLIGLACTATIVTDRPKRGQHRAHVAAWTQHSVNHYYVKLKKTTRIREQEEELVSRIIVNALAKAMNIDLELPLQSADGDDFEMSDCDIASEAANLLKGKSACFGVSADGIIQKSPRPRAILSGAFNPLHEGHINLARAAESILEEPVMFEVAAINAEKGALEINDLLGKLTQFAGKHPVIASTTPIFLDKARLFHKSTFVVGYDTAVRIFQPKYYGDSNEKMLAALEEIRNLGCQFLVAGRMDEKGRFHDAASLQIPDPYRALFIPIPAEKFRFDLSSTKLRTGSS